MARAEINSFFERIERLVKEMNDSVPINDIKFTEFRGDLAGLLVVSIASSYESCVKEILINYASSLHDQFGTFARKNYEKMNSRVRVKDLKNYTKLFGSDVEIRFKENLNITKEKIMKRTGKNIETCYEQILNWRHDFAHAGNRNTTIDEALAFHRLAKRVLFVFDKAFSDNGK